MRAALVLSSIAVAIAAPAAAQVSKTPDAAEVIRTLGARWDAEVNKTTVGVYLKLQAAVPKDGVRIERDIAYGPDERHKLDIHTPAARPSSPAPVVVYFHGGGFTGGTRSREGLIYDNVATYMARHGLIGVNATYRLAPKHKWPSGSQDVGAAVKWLHDNVAKHGGDPNRIVVIGHSAGASLVAGYIFNETLHPPGGDGLAGAVLMSGTYTPNPNDKRNVAYYGDDTSQYAARAPINLVPGRKLPTFVVFAEYDPYRMQRQALQMFDALCERDKSCPRIMRVSGHNHMSEAAHIGLADESVGPAILDFVAASPAASTATAVSGR